MYPAQASPMDLTITARDERGRTKDAIGEIETRWNAPIGSEDGAADVMSAGRIRKGKPAVSRMIDDTRLIRAITDMVVPLTLRVTCGTRRARALPPTLRGDVGRSRDSKARARPARQVHAFVGQHLPAEQKSKIVKRGTAHRFSTSRYARMVARGSRVMVRLRRPRRGGEKVVRPFPMWRVRPP